MEDVSRSLNASELDEDKLIQAIEKHNPTVLSLSFCYTNVSDLNDILRSAGIYSVLIMSKDQANITEGKYVVLDPAQKMVIEKVAENQPKNVFLWGSSGTGKTFLITQILGMKISHYKKEGKQLNVIVSSYVSAFDTTPLLDEFQNKYLEHLALEDNIHFTPFEKLCKELGLECGRDHPLVW